MANTVNLSALTEYVAQNVDQLFVKSVAGAKTLDYIALIPNVKYKTALHLLDSSVVLADGSVCEWDPAGDDTFSERMLEVKPVKVQKEFCIPAFREKVSNLQMNFEAGREKLPWQEKIAESNVNEIRKAVEYLIWRGDANLGISGLTEIASAETGSVKVEFASGATSIAKVDAVVAAIPVAALAKGVNIFMSYTDFRNYVAEQNASCCANRPIVDAAAEAIKYPGDSRIQIVPVLGLEKANSGDTAYIVAAPADVLVYGTDLEGSETVYKWFMDEKTDTMNFKSLFNAGVQIALPSDVVIGA